MSEEATREPTEAKPEPTEGEAEATREPEGPTGTPKGADDAEDEANLTDRHGQPAISRGKYEREMAAKDKRIAELEEKVSEAAKTEASRKELQDQIDRLKAEAAADKVAYRLELAGCLNVKAARAVLEDHDGDVDKLKADCPYLFKTDKPKAGTTGLANGGAPDGAAERRRRARESAGLKP